MVAGVASVVAFLGEIIGGVDLFLLNARRVQGQFKGGRMSALIDEMSLQDSILDVLGVS